MPEEINRDNPAAKRICYQCVGEAFLSEEIKRSGSQAECDYCGEVETSWMIGDLAVSVEKAFDEHYIRTSDQPGLWQQGLLADKDLNYEWEREGDPVVEAIEGAAEIPHQAAIDVTAILANKHASRHHDEIGEESEFERGTYYERKSIDSGAWQYEWWQFARSLQTEARFFSKAAAAHLASVFGGIDKIKTKNRRRPVVVHAGPRGTIKSLYRSRVFQSNSKLEEALGRPDLQLGSPPAQLASAGRMNARGISVFYGAMAAGTAIAEVRPPVGSKVAIAKFDIVRPLRLLDLPALELVMDGGSIFDPSLKARLERVAFLRTLGLQMTRPVMPDEEALSYLATQAVADFLATENDPALDGIIFRSVQVKDGRNVVLFHKAARIEELELPPGTTIDVHCFWDPDEEASSMDYWVSERVPLASKKPPPTKGEPDPLFGDFPFGDFIHSDQATERPATLRVDVHSVEVHEIDWVSFRSTKYKVSRHRTQKGKEKF